MGNVYTDREFSQPPARGWIGQITKAPALKPGDAVIITAGGSAGFLHVRRVFGFDGEITAASDWEPNGQEEAAKAAGTWRRYRWPALVAAEGVYRPIAELPEVAAGGAVSVPAHRAAVWPEVAATAT